jgi:hypothetical protein
MLTEGAGLVESYRRELAPRTLFGCERAGRINVEELQGVYP